MEAIGLEVSSVGSDQLELAEGFACFDLKTFVLVVPFFCFGFAAEVFSLIGGLEGGRLAFVWG